MMKRKLRQIINKWKEIIAISVSRYKKQEGQKTITINSTLWATKLILLSSPLPRHLILGREDLGIQYNMRYG